MRLAEVADHDLPIAYTMVQRLLKAGKQVTLALLKSEGITRIGWLEEIEIVDGLYHVGYRTNHVFYSHFTQRQLLKSTIKTIDNLRGGTGEPELCLVVPVAAALDRDDNPAAA